jgi:hypothetical protein
MLNNDLTKTLFDVWLPEPFLVATTKAQSLTIFPSEDVFGSYLRFKALTGYLS